MSEELSKKLQGIIDNARLAFLEIEKSNEKKINLLLKNLAKHVLSRKNNHYLSNLAVKETNFGNVKDKIFKNEYKTNSLIKEINSIEIFKPIFDKKKNIYKILKPIGVLCGVTPSTNPIATTLNYIINAIKARNSIIICPNPRSYETVFELINIIKKKLKSSNFSENLVSIAPKEILRSELITMLFEKCDKNIVTGSKFFINSVKKTSKPFLVFGTGNPPIIVDQDVKIKEVVKSIIASKSFDYSTSCSADSVLIVDSKIYDNFLIELKKQKTFILNKEQRKSLDKIYFNRGVINTKIIAKSPEIILEKISVKNQKKIQLIAYEYKYNKLKHYILNEKILPIVAVIKSNNFNTSLEIANFVLDCNGIGHSAGIYSKNIKNILRFSKVVNASRVIVNQPHSKSAGGNPNNGLNTTLSLGCGNWGNNILNNNLSLKDFCNITRVVLKKN